MMSPVIIIWETAIDFVTAFGVISIKSFIPARDSDRIKLWHPAMVNLRTCYSGKSEIIAGIMLTL